MSWVLWGFHPNYAHNTVIKLTGGALGHCRSERTYREGLGGWKLAIHKEGTEPVALRLMSPVSYYGPVGALVFGSYWTLVHRVLSHNADGSVTVEAIDHPLNSGQWKQERSVLGIKTHSTRLGGRDRIIALPIPGVKANA